MARQPDWGALLEHALDLYLDVCWLMETSWFTETKGGGQYVCKWCDARADDVDDIVHVADPEDFTCPAGVVEMHLKNIRDNEVKER